MITNKKSLTFLLNTITGWDEPPRARHQVTYALAQYHNVVFVAHNKIGWFGIKAEKAQHNVILITPSFPLDYRLRYRIPLLNELYQQWLFRRLKNLYNYDYVINFDFTARLISKYFPKAIYYCNDEFTGNSKYRNFLVDLYIKRCERMVAISSRFCIATSQYLVNKLKKYNINTFEIPLGVSMIGKKPVYRHNKQSESITVCLMGVINERQFSIVTINKMLSIKNINLMLIGPVEPDFLKKLYPAEKIICKGVLKGDELYHALSQVDIGLALYNRKRINPGTTSNKLWQYLSVGIPVVIADLDNLKNQEFPEKSVYKFNHDEEIIDIIITAHDENTEQLFNKRIDFAKENTWEKRMELFFEILTKSF